MEFDTSAVIRLRTEELRKQADTIDPALVSHGTLFGEMPLGPNQVVAGTLFGALALANLHSPTAAFADDARPSTLPPAVTSAASYDVVSHMPVVSAPVVSLPKVSGSGIVELPKLQLQSYSTLADARAASDQGFSAMVKNAADTVGSKIHESAATATGKVLSTLDTSSQDKMRPVSLDTAKDTLKQDKVDSASGAQASNPSTLGKSGSPDTSSQPLKADKQAEASPQSAQNQSDKKSDQTTPSSPVPKPSELKDNPQQTPNPVVKSAPSDAGQSDKAANTPSPSDNGAKAKTPDSAPAQSPVATPPSQLKDTQPSPSDNSNLPANKDTNSDKKSGLSGLIEKSVSHIPFLSSLGGGHENKAPTQLAPGTSSAPATVNPPQETPKTVTAPKSAPAVAPTVGGHDTKVDQTPQVLTTHFQDVDIKRFTTAPTQVVSIPLPDVASFASRVFEPVLMTPSPAATATASPAPVTETAPQPTASGLVFPLKISADAIKNNKGMHWCYSSTANCHHDYNAADIFAPTGTEELAPVDGTVIAIGDHDNSIVGSRVQIRANDGTLYYMAHMGDGTVAVRPGEHVKAGVTVVGKVGTNADAMGTPSHLHIDREPAGTPRRVSCSGASCHKHPFLPIQADMVQAFKQLQGGAAAAPAPSQSNIRQAVFSFLSAPIASFTKPSSAVEVAAPADASPSSTTELPKDDVVVDAPTSFVTADIKSHVATPQETVIVAAPTLPSTDSSPSSGPAVTTNTPPPTNDAPKATPPPAAAPTPAPAPTEQPTPKQEGKFTPEQEKAALEAAILMKESSGKWDTGPGTYSFKTYTCSGGYQMSDAMWGKYGGYAHAYQAPARLQHERADQVITEYLKKFDGDEKSVAMAWYAGPGFKKKNTTSKQKDGFPAIESYGEDIMKRIQKYEQDPSTLPQIEGVPLTMSNPFLDGGRSA